MPDVATLEVSEVVEAREPWRPTIRTEANREAILECMRVDGMAFSRACEEVGISKAGGSEWRSADANFANATAQAEANYLRSKMSDLRACRTKWGTPDPKALELELRRFPEFRQHQETTVTSTSLSVTVTVAPDQLASLQAMRMASLTERGEVAK